MKNFFEKIGKIFDYRRVNSNVLRSRKFKSVIFVLVMVLSLSPIYGQTPRETLSITNEFEFDAHLVTGGDFQSPVVTYNGVIYYVWVDPQLRTIIAKKLPDGTLTTNVIFQQTDNDPWHNGASVGIDRDGYIHVVGNMHNSPYRGGLPENEAPWQYVVSDNPEDISSFTFVGSDRQRTIPGTWITYPFFARGRNGTLYVAFRHRVKFGIGWVPGIMAAGLARYDAGTKSWTMLGGTDYLHGQNPPSDPLVSLKTFFWNNSGSAGIAYQPYRPRIFFDKNNRMHVTWVADDGNGGDTGFTQVLYAYSDDGGNTFRRADGTAYSSLPITIASGDVVVGPPWTGSNGSLEPSSYVGVLADGRPAVAFARRDDRTAWWSFWNGSAWSVPTRLPFDGNPARILTDSNGVITAVDGANKLHRSFDNGATWQTYDVETVGIHSINFDYYYFAQTNQLRFQTFSTRSLRVKVWTVKFSGNDTEPPTDDQPPSAPENLEVTLP